MKKLTLLSMICLLSASCKNTWDSEARELFHQSCMEDAKDNNMTEADATSRCDCRLEKVMEKYPNFSQAMKHTEDIMSDPDIKACK